MRTNQNVIYKYKYVLIGKKLIWVLGRGLNIIVLIKNLLL